MNHETKILFTDLDGTLLNDQKQISKGNLTAIHKSLDCGHKIVISTGRALISARKQAETLGLTMPGCYIIAFNGACIYDIHAKKVIFSQTIPVDYVYALFEEAHRQGIHIQTYDDTQVLTESENENLFHYCRNTGMDYKVVSSIRNTMTTPPYKLLAVDYQHHTSLVQFQDHIHNWSEGKVDSYFSCDSLLEIIAPGISKGNAIIRLCEKLQIPLESTISAGDADNDISMLQTTHTSVVMKNANPHMHAYATYITEHDNNHDGVAEAIYKFMVS